MLKPLPGTHTWGQLFVNLFLTWLIGMPGWGRKSTGSPTSTASGIALCLTQIWDDDLTTLCEQAP